MPARNYVKRNPTATAAGTTGIIVAGLVTIAARFGLTLDPAEVALLALVVGFIPVGVRWILDHKGW